MIVVALVDELGVGGDQADQLLAAHRRLAGRLGLEVGDELHDVVVVDHRRGEEDELEIELIDGRTRSCSPGLPLLLTQPLGGFEVLRRGRR